MNFKNSLSYSNIIELKKYFPVSKINVAPIVIRIIVILFSFEKFLSKYEPKNPIIQNITAETPITLP
jgi:hypothetical protein